MIKNWKLEKKPSRLFPDRGILFIDSSLEEAKTLKKCFSGILGVVFKSGRSDLPWAMYVYGASENILKLIEQEIGVIAAGKKKPEKKAEFPKPAETTKKPLQEEIKAEKKPEASPQEKEKEKVQEEKPEVKEKPKEEKKEEKKPISAEVTADREEKPEEKKVEIKIEKFEKPTEEKVEAVTPRVEHFEKLTPDSAAEPPVAKPIIERFDEKVAEPPKAEEEGKRKEDEKKEKKGAQAIKIIYFCPEAKQDLINQVKSSIETIISEKNINFTFEAVANIIYGKDEPRQDIIGRIVQNKFSFIIAVAPDENGENILRELKRKGYIPKVITEDNIDKKFRYLNLITDIVLSPRK
jgi:hypothetical protein